MRVLRRGRTIIDGAEREPDNDTVNLTPLIDIVLIILIFFIMTATFDKMSGVEIERATADSAASVVGVRIRLTENRLIYWDAVRMSIAELSVRLKARLADEPDLSVIIEADRRADVETLLNVIDLVRDAGAERVLLGAAFAGDRDAYRTD